MTIVNGRVSLSEKTEAAFQAHCLQFAIFRRLGGLTMSFLVQEEGGEDSGDGGSHEGSPDMADMVMHALKRCGKYMLYSSPSILMDPAHCPMSVSQSVVTRIKTSDDRPQGKSLPNAQCSLSIPSACANLQECQVDAMGKPASNHAIVCSPQRVHHPHRSVCIIGSVCYPLRSGIW